MKTMHSDEAKSKGQENNVQISRKISQSGSTTLNYTSRKTNNQSVSRIGIAFLIPGIFSLVLSFLQNSQILAFIGLGLTFWGALFFLVKPVRYVESSLLDLAASSSYATIDRIVKDFQYKEKGYYIPPYPKEVYLPDHLKGLKDMIVCIFKDSETGIPTVDEIAQSKFLLNPEGIGLTPPGLGLLERFEKELKVDMAKMQPDELLERINYLVLEDLKLAGDLQIKTDRDTVLLTTIDSAFENLYEQDLRSVYYLGCPLASAIACAIAKSTGKKVTIERNTMMPDSHLIETLYRILEG